MSDEAKQSAIYGSKLSKFVNERAAIELHEFKRKRDALRARAAELHARLAGM